MKFVTMCFKPVNWNLINEAIIRTSQRAVLVFVAVTSMSNAVLAANNACLLEGTVTALGTTKEVKDCIQNNGATELGFKKTCQLVSDMAALAGAPPAKITYMDACPKAPQATCAGFFGQPMTSYYYKRSKDLLASSKKGCEMQGGKWN